MNTKTIHRGAYGYETTTYLFKNIHAHTHTHTPQAFDQERARMDSECNMSCKLAQELRRNYQNYAKLTHTNKKKLQSSLAKDPPKLAEQERCGILRGRVLKWGWGVV